jgi:hypothetical protein
MTAARRSYLKTIYLAFGGLGFAAVLLAITVDIDLGIVRLPLQAAAGAGGLVCLFVVAAGLVVLHRERRACDGRPDLFVELNRDRSEPELAKLGMEARFPGRSLLRRLLAPYQFEVGEVVEICSWETIQQTLDARGTLDGVPFMREMLPHCGQRVRILRYVDKVYDYGKSKTLRRVNDCVLLVNLRCDGSAHGGCQARCSMFWKTAWLKRPGAPDNTAPARSDRDRTTEGVAKAMTEQYEEPYTCQYTEVAAASSPMKWWDIRKDLRPLLSGNVSLPAFVVALLTRAFNRVQGLRGGVPFPQVSNSGQSKTPVVTKNMRTSDAVAVLSMQEIGQTLDAGSRNRGLWFDREMTKHCRQSYKVLQRVDRIIDDATRRMVPMKTPCIVLEDVVATGEFLHFCAQQEYLFWREAWLRAESEGTRQA